MIKTLDELKVAVLSAKPLHTVLFSEEALFRLCPDLKLTDRTVCGVPFELFLKDEEMYRRVGHLHKQGSKTLVIH